MAFNWLTSWSYEYLLFVCSIVDFVLFKLHHLIIKLIWDCKLLSLIFLVSIIEDRFLIIFTAKITSFSKCIFRVYLIQGCNQKISLYLIWKSIICSTKSLLNHPFIYFLKGEIHVLNLNRISVIRIDSLLIFCISNLICRDQNKIYNFHLLTSSRLSAIRDKNNNECFILCNPG